MKNSRVNQINNFAKIQFHFTQHAPAVRENVFLLHIGAERLPRYQNMISLCRRQMDKIIIYLDVFFQSISE